MKKAVISICVYFSFLASIHAQEKESVIVIARKDKSIESVMHERWGVIYPMSITAGLGYSNDAYSFRDDESGTNSSIAITSSFQFHVKRFGGGIEALYSKNSTEQGRYWDETGGSAKSLAMKLSYRSGRRFFFELGYNVLDRYKVDNTSVTISELDENDNVIIHDMVIPVVFKGHGYFVQGNYRLSRKLSLGLRFSQSSYKKVSAIQEDDYPKKFKKGSSLSNNLPAELVIRKIGIILSYQFGIL